MAAARERAAIKKDAAEAKLASDNAMRELNDIRAQWNTGQTPRASVVGTARDECSASMAYMPRASAPARRRRDEVRAAWRPPRRPYRCPVAEEVRDEFLRDGSRQHFGGCITNRRAVDLEDRVAVDDAPTRPQNGDRVPRAAARLPLIIVERQRE